MVAGTLNSSFISFCVHLSSKLIQFLLILFFFAILNILQVINVLFFFQWLPESARYHVASGQPDKALETLQKVSNLFKPVVCLLFLLQPC